MGLLDQISDTLSQATQTINDKAGQMIDITKQNNRVKEAEKLLDDTYKQIGMLVYESKQDGSTPDLSELLLTVDRLKSAIEDAQSSIRVLRGSGVCSACGTEVPAGSYYCPKCGAKQTQEGKCPNCGGVLSAGSNICPNCGMKVGI